MALVPLLTHPSLSLAPHNYHSQPGAFRILVQLNRHHRELNASHNPLGAEGVSTLVNGFDAMRWRLVPPTDSDEEDDEEPDPTGHATGDGRAGRGESSRELASNGKNQPRGGWEGPPRIPQPQERGWGMVKLNLADCELHDEGLCWLLEYCKIWKWCRHLDVASNRIELKPANLDRLLPLLHSTSLKTLNLSSNPFDPSSLTSLLHSLPPTLQTLKLSLCSLPSACARPLTRFLRSSRSHSLSTLELNGNQLGVSGASQLIDAIEEGNFRLTQLGLAANGIPTLPGEEERGDPVAADLDSAFLLQVGPEARRSREIDAEFLRRRCSDEEIAMNEQVHVRLPQVLERNRQLQARAREAALKVYGPARVILNGIGLEPDSSGTAHKTKSSFPLAYFPLFRLPPHLISLVVLHCSEDPTALSSAQWNRLKQDATHRERWQGRRQRRRRWKENRRDREEVREAEANMKDRWVDKGDYGRWEDDGTYSDSEAGEEGTDKGEPGTDAG